MKTINKFIRMAKKKPRETIAALAIIAYLGVSAITDCVDFCYNLFKQNKVPSKEYVIKKYSIDFPIREYKKAE